MSIGQYKDVTERMHVARYEFAKALCINKTVADIASGTGYGMDILRDTATSVDGFDKEKFGNNIIIDLEKQAWSNSYDVIQSGILSRKRSTNLKAPGSLDAAQ